MKKKSLFYSREARSEIRRRMVWVVLFFFIGFGAVFYRIVFLHLTPDSRLKRLARTQYQATVVEAPPRGTIYDARGSELAVSIPTYSLAVRPPRVAEPTALTDRLSRVLSLPRRDLWARVTSGKKFVWVKRHLSPEEVSRLKPIDDPGLEWIRESKRYYPNRELAAQILGAVGVGGEALGGLELAYDPILKGKNAPTRTYRDARGHQLEFQTPREGMNEGPYDLSLTIDQSIQYTVESELKQACRANRAKACTGIVMDARTGGILAMASTPTFNPNSFSRYDWGRWKNRAITDGFEPGSIFKVVTAAAALEGEVVGPEERLFCENGSVQVGNHEIRDIHPHGLLTFRDIMKVSSNIGFFKIGERVGKKRLASLIDEMGFGKKVGIDFPGEEDGSVRPYTQWKEIDFANLSFGQGIRVTPIQILRAYAAIASGGLNVRPHFVSKVTTPDGQVVWRAEAEARRVLKPRTAQILTEMLEEATEEGGTGSLARIPGYTVAGKTGTAQKVKNGSYSHTDFVSSFVGFAPAEDPRLVALVILDEPQGEVYGGLTAAPVFRRIVWGTLRELGVPPQEAPAPRQAVFQASLGPLRLGSEAIASPGSGFGKGLPSFVGLSMKEVLGLLEERRIPAILDGSGVAYAQTPEAGVVLKEGEVCRISFRASP